MPAEIRFTGGRTRRAIIRAASEVGIALPWLFFAWLNFAVACHRWTSWRLALSLGACAIAAVAGWLLVRRAAARYDDAHLGDLLAPVEDAPPWAMFPHPAQAMKREHTARCRTRWGVTPRTSGWTLFRLSWRADGGRALGWLVVVVHALWFGL